MAATTIPSTSETYWGHVRKGVIVLDTPMPLTEGAPVRIEMLTNGKPALTPAEKATQFQQLMEKWNEEDAQLTEEQQDLLRKGLEKHRGLRFDNLELDDLLT